MTISNEPAFPVECSYSEGGKDIRGVQTGSYSGWCTGLTKREYFAALAMQGLLAARNGFMVDIGTETVGSYAVRCADSLLAELAKEPTDAE